jgi:ABC-2 type transport system ATP-binding protein
MRLEEEMNDMEQSTRVSRRAASAAALTDAIRVERLRKVYGDAAAVEDVSFSVAPGEIFALLGPNGAGKTTTIEILEGYRRADGGTVSVLGRDPQRDGALKTLVGVMLQQDGVYPSLRPPEVLNLYASFFADPESPEQLLALVGLTEAARTRCRQLSGGQKRRLALALALVGKPRLLFLDEPTTGMDPQARRATWELLLDLKDRGVTILLTTHFMDEAERLADRIGILDHGRLIALDTPANLTREQSTTTVEARFSADPAPDLAKLVKLTSIRTARVESPGTYIVETGDAPAMLVELTTFLRDSKSVLRELRVGRASLEDVFLRLTGKDMRE